ncbi:MAG: AEC family transporter [Tissierellia bacterium]|jgi:predicted permease|nr:AEC family transporter [Tissierellia bacterium]
MNFLLTLQNVSVLFTLIVIGYLVGKLNWVTASGQKEITKLVLNVTMPATIILAMQVPFSLERVQNILILLGIMLACYIFMFIVGWLVTKLFPGSPGQKDIFHMGMLLSNTSFMGYPIVLALLGDDALFYAVICGGFLFEIISWTLGIHIIGRNVAGNKGGLKNAILNPGVLSIAVGGILFLTNISIPEPLFSTMNLLSRATSPLAMLVVGLILSRSNIKEALKDWRIYVASAIKLFINPLAILFTLKFLGFDGIFIVIPVMLLSMPTAAYIAMFSDNLGNDKSLASQLVFVCSLLSLISIPIIGTLIL